MENPNFAPNSFSTPPEPQRNNTPIIVAIVAVIALCCCCLSIAVGYYVWNNY